MLKLHACIESKLVRSSMPAKNTFDKNWQVGRAIKGNQNNLQTTSPRRKEREREIEGAK